MGQFGTHDATDPFHDEIREMLRRRSGDVPEHSRNGHVTVGPVPSLGPADAVEPIDGRFGRAPRRRGRAAFVLAAAAVVLIAGGLGLVANNFGATDSEPVDAAGAEQATGTFLAPPQAVVDEYDFAIDFTEDEGRWFYYGPPDGDGTQGLTLHQGLGLFGEPLGSVSPAESEWLAAADAFYFPGPKLQMPAANGEQIWLSWYGPDIDQAQVLAAAELLIDDAVVLDESAVVDLPVPDGWELLWRSDQASLVSSATFDLASGETMTLLRFPEGTPLMAADYSNFLGDESTRLVAEVRGTQALTTTIDGLFDNVVWQEGGFTWSALIGSGEGLVDDPIGLVEDLQLVDVSTLELPEQLESDRVTDAPTPPTTPPSPGGTTATTGPPGELPEEASTTHFDNVVSTVTAPGPGATSDPAVSTTINPGTDPSTTGPGSTGTASTFDLPTTAAPPTTVPYRPEGPFVEDAVYVVAADELAGRSYNVGVYWSSIWGFCVGAIFDEPASVGGFPSVCESEPRIGGGFYAVDPERGVLLFVYTPSTIDAATLTADNPDNPTGAEQQATLHQVPEFPEFTFAVFELEGVTEVPYPLYWVSLWNEGQAVGWG